MSLGTFKTLVSDEVNKGSLHDAAIASRIKMAAKWFERNLPMKYMHRWVSFTIDPLAAEPRLIIPPPRVRNYEFVRIVKSDGTFGYLNKIEAMDVGRVEEGTPKQFWLDGRENLVLDTTPVESLSAEMGYFQYSDWNGLGDTQDHWLLSDAEDAMLAQTMLLMAAFLREGLEFVQRYKLMRDEAIVTITSAEEDFAHGAAESIRMLYHDN